MISTWSPFFSGVCSGVCSAVDLGAHRRVADIGMHGIGKIDRRGAARKRNQLAFGRKAEHLVLIHAQLGMFVEFLRAFAAFKQIDHIAQPLVGADGGRIALVDLLAITPMGGDAAFRHVVHFLGADLHLDALVFRPDHGGMDGAVAVGFRQ